MLSREKEETSELTPLENINYPFNVIVVGTFYKEIEDRMFTAIFHLLDYSIDESRVYKKDWKEGYAVVVLSNRIVILPVFKIEEIPPFNVRNPTQIHAYLTPNELDDSIMDIFIGEGLVYV